MGAINAHHELLIAGAAIPRALKDQPLAVMAEIGLGILAAVRQLANVAEVCLARLRRRRDWMGQGLSKRNYRNDRKQSADNRNIQSSSWGNRMTPFGD